MDVFETAQLKGSLKYATASELDELLSAFRSQQEMTAANVVLNEMRSRKITSNPEPESSPLPVQAQPSKKEE
jgi:hypothetical protein